MERETFYKKYNDTEKVNKIIQDFHDLYYESSCIGGTWKNTYWMGVPTQKCPLDCWVYQELIYNIRPDYIIETGSKVGGSALFFASICDMIGNGKIITVDINGKGKLPEHERISYLWANSVDEATINFINPKVKDKKVMVILDSDHSKSHVLKELEIYSKFVSVGSYIIVEDTNTAEPLEAVFEFIGNSKNFIIDRYCEKFYLSFAPYGFLKRVK